MKNIPAKEYMELKGRYESKLYELDEKIEQAEKQRKISKQSLNNAVLLLSNLSKYYEQSDPENKHAIVSSICTGPVYFLDGKVRTQSINSVIDQIATYDKSYRTLDISQNEETSKMSCSVARTRLVIELQRLADCNRRIA